MFWLCQWATSECLSSENCFWNPAWNAAAVVSKADLSTAQLNRQGMVREVLFIYFWFQLKSLKCLLPSSLSSQFGKLCGKGSVAGEGGLTSVPKMKARARGCLLNPTFLTTVFLTAPDTTGLWDEICLEPVLQQHCREAVCRGGEDGFSPEGSFPRAASFGLSCLSEGAWVSWLCGCQARQGPIPAGLCAGYLDGTHVFLGVLSPTTV